MGCCSALAATTPRAPAPSYLFSIPTASGSLTGPNDQHLMLRLTGARDYLTQFADRPLRQAFVVANVDFARRFKSYFAGSAPNAVLTYTPRGAQIPVSIVLTIRKPRWNAQHHTWTFPATRIRKQPDNLPGTTIHIKPPLIPNPRNFTQATLLIDDSGGCVMQPYGQCPYAEFSYSWFYEADLDHANLSDAFLNDANLYGADLSYANLSFADLEAADLQNANLTGANLTRADLAYANLIGAVGANLSSDNLCYTVMPDGSTSGCSG